MGFGVSIVLCFRDNCLIFFLIYLGNEKEWVIYKRSFLVWYDIKYLRDF